MLGAVTLSAVPDPGRDQYLVLLALQFDEAHPPTQFFLASVEALDFPKSQIVLCIALPISEPNYFGSWIARMRSVCADLLIVGAEENSNGELPNTSFLQESLSRAVERNCTHYFVVSCQSYLRPNVLQTLIETGLAIVAPLLRTSNLRGLYSNFHESVDDAGYFKRSDAYNWLVTQQIRGLCLVAVVHGTYLVKREAFNAVTYIDGTSRHEYVIFSTSARRIGVPQYLDTREIYGYIHQIEETGPVEALIGKEVTSQGVWPEQVFWGGAAMSKERFVPHEAIFDPEQDFRVPAMFHQSFDIVNICERDLGKVKQWPLVLDEALRLLSPNGRLFVRFSQTQFLNSHGLAQRIFAWTKGAVKLQSRQNGPDNGEIWTLRLTTTERRPASVDSFTFGIITDGRRPEMVKAFVASVRALDRLDSCSLQIVICGPEEARDALGADADGIDFIVPPDRFPEFAWITHKKNLIVKAATSENVLVAHDRYMINKDFISQVRAFGGDFDVIVPREVTVEGERYLDWVTTGPDRSAAGVGLMAYGDYNPNAYVQGGIIFAKRHTLLETPWNDMLFWGQAEDVELSRRLLARGLVGRLARTIEVTTHVTRGGLKPYFQNLRWSDDEYIDPV